MTIEFTIHGNQEDPRGNPIPKLKMTGRQHWTEKAHRYVAWKSYVCDAFVAELRKYVEKGGLGIKLRPSGAIVAWVGKEKPITLEKNQDACMDLKIYWADERHPDPENVFGSIADALFESDKHLDGSFEAGHNPEKKGRVEVKITIS